jgi:hypothetical protein
MAKQAVNGSNWKLCVIGFGLLLTGTNAAISMEYSSLDICMAQEMDVTALIEGSGETGDLTPDKLAEVSLIMLHAAAACDEGRINEAIALYDSIFALGAIIAGPTQSAARLLGNGIGIEK